MPKTSDALSMRKSMPRTLEEKLEALEPQRHAAVEAAAVRLHAEYLIQVQTTEYAPPTPH
jgi:hypothetical protein